MRERMLVLKIKEKQDKYPEYIKKLGIQVNINTNENKNKKRGE